MTYQAYEIIHTIFGLLYACAVYFSTGKFYAYPK